MEYRQAAGYGLTFIGLILFVDQLYMFGIPFGPILPDLSAFHIEPFHHWMLGLVLMPLGLYLASRVGDDL